MFPLDEGIAEKEFALAIVKPETHFIHMVREILRATYAAFSQPRVERT